MIKQPRCTYWINRTISPIKTAVLTIVFFAVFFNSQGQVQIQMRPVNPFHFTPEQSWEMDILSLKEKNFRIKAFARISGRNGAVIADLESDVLMISKGLNSFHSLTTQTQKIHYSLTDYGAYVEAAGKFPSGEYRVCLRFECLTPDCDGAGADALLTEPSYCKDVTVELPTPLLLASPFDKSELEVTRPMFTWIPPMPIAGMLELRYVFTLTEKREGQSKIDAIKRNRPLIQEGYVERPSLMFPTDAEELEYEKDYVWQVEAWYGNLYIATSDVWEFKLKMEDSIVETFNFSQSYIELNKQDGGVIYTVVDELRLRYETRLSSDIITCTVRKEMEGITGSVMKLNTTLGDNRISVNLKDYKGITHGNTYVLEFKNSQGNVFRIKILYYDIEKTEDAEVIRKRKSDLTE